ncbi:MAG TPA: NUDIX domain-containing protein [Nevskiaceae bacterium]|nr:NUDIX domain-containing protein [Nevskiaceae bacterium]
MTFDAILVVDEQDRPMGMVSKREVWQRGMLHRIVRIMVENEQGTRVLLQKRSHAMELFPDCWDHTGGGHVESGETYEQAAYRELQEETGISGVRLEEIAHYRTHDTFHDRILNRFNTLYRARIPLQPIIAHNQEVNQVHWFTIEEAKRLVRDHPDQVTDGLTQVLRDYY